MCLWSVVCLSAIPLWRLLCCTVTIPKPLARDLHLPPNLPLDAACVRASPECQLS